MIPDPATPLAVLALSTSEARTLAIAALCLVPFLLACWGLATLFAGADGRRAFRDLAPAERLAYQAEARAYGRKVGLIAVPLAVASAVTYRLADSGLAAAAVLAGGLLLAVPLFVRLSSPLRERLVDHSADG